MEVFKMFLAWLMFVGFSILLLSIFRVFKRNKNDSEYHDELDHMETSVAEEASNYGGNYEFVDENSSVFEENDVSRVHSSASSENEEESLLDEQMSLTRAHSFVEYDKKSDQDLDSSGFEFVDVVSVEEDAN